MKFKLHLVDKNPFHPLPRAVTTIIEANNKEEIEAFWKEAKEQGMEVTRDLNLGKIEELVEEGGDAQ